MTAILAQSSFTRTDLIVLVGYLLGVVALGAYFVRKSRTVEGFTLGSRALPGWAIGLSILGTYLSSMTFLGLPGKAYNTNWNFFVFSLTLPVAALVAVIWFIPIYRRMRLVSAYEFLEVRLGLGGRTYAAVCFVLLQMVRMAAILYLVAIAVERIVGWDELWQVILVAGVLITLYTVLGGIEAVIWTDVVQVVVLIAGALFSLAVLLMGFPEGPGQLFRVAAEQGKFSFEPYDWSITQSTVLVVVIYGLAENLKNFGVDQGFVQRFLAARSDKAAARSLWIGALAYIPLAALFFLIGTALFSYYTVHPEQLAESVAGQGDRIFPFFIQQQLPTGIRGVLLAAILAAAMSTVDSGLNSASTVCMVDFYKRRFRPDADDARSLRFVRCCTVILGVVGTLGGIAMIEIVRYKENAIDAWWELAGVIGGPFLGLFLLAVLARRVRGSVVAVSLVACILTMAWVTFSEHLPDSWAPFRCQWDGKMAGPTGTAVMLVVGLLLAGFRATDPAASPEDGPPNPQNTTATGSATITRPGPIDRARRGVG